MRLNQTINDGPIDFDIDKIEDFGCANPELTKALYDLFRLYGSDKSTVHDYFGYYADCLYKLGQDKELSILELGLGSNTNLHSLGPWAAEASLEPPLGRFETWYQTVGYTVQTSTKGLCSRRIESEHLTLTNSIPSHSMTWLQIWVKPVSI